MNVSSTRPGFVRRYATLTHDRCIPWLASFGLVIYWLVLGNRYSMWYDEAFSSRQSTLSPFELARSLLRIEANLGPYYIVLWIWEKVLPGPWMARGLSVVGTVLTVHGIWVLMRRRVDTFAATTAILVFVTNPFVLRWTLQMRGHTLVMACTVWALVCAEDLVRCGDRKSAVRLGVLIGIASATMLSSVPVHVGMCGAVLIAVPTRAMVRRVSLVVLSALVVFAPFVPAFVARRSQISWIPPLDAQRFFDESLRAVGGTPTAILYSSAVVLVVVAAIRRRQARPFAGVLLIGLWGFVGLALISVTVQPMFVDRYLAASIPLVCLGILGGSFAFAGWKRTAFLAGLAAGGVVVTAVWSAHALPPNHDFRWAISQIEALGRPGDAVLTIPRYQLLSVEENWGEGRDRFTLLSRAPALGKPIIDEAGNVVEPKRVWVVELLQDEWRDIDRLEFGQVTTAYPSQVSTFEKGPLAVQLWTTK